MRKVLKNNLIITLGREFGSGGRVIGKLLAEELQLPYYDSKLIELISDSTGISKKVIEAAEESVSKLFYSFMFSGGGDKIHDLSLNDRIFVAQAETIRNLAREGSCIFVGRCADYVLKDEFNILKVFIYRDKKSREEYAVKNYGVDQKKAKAQISKSDKKRAEYYSYYTGMKWGHPSNYDLYLNSSMGQENVVKMIKYYLKIYYNI